MNRKNKNIIMISCLIGLIIISIFTMKYYSRPNEIMSSPNNMFEENREEYKDFKDNINRGENKNKQIDNDNETDNNKKELKKKNRQKDNIESNEEIQKNIDKDIKDNNKRMPSNMKFDRKNKDLNHNNLSITSYILFGFESILIGTIIIYLIMSNFNNKTFKKTFNSIDKIIIFILSDSIITIALTYSFILIVKNTSIMI